MKEEKEIPTAHESLLAINVYWADLVRLKDCHENIEKVMIKFAKLHVKAALEEAAKSAITATGYDENGIPFKYVDRNYILNAYPESNIK